MNSILKNLFQLPNSHEISFTFMPVVFSYLSECHDESPVFQKQQESDHMFYNKIQFVK